VKLDARRLRGFLSDPGACRVVLLYGDDTGLIRERAETLIRSAAGGLNDPFRLAELGRDEIARLPTEAASLSLTGGRRVVRVREAGDSLTASVQNVLKGQGEALVVLEAPGLTGRSRLRSLLEAAPDGAAIGCYPEEGRALEETIRASLAEARVSVDLEALAWLAGQLGADRASTRQEISKLALYAGPGGRVDMEVAAACVGDLAGLQLDDALFAATAGDIARTDRALELAISEGASPVGVVRTALLHLERLHRARLAVDAGQTPAEATKAARPPVFFRRVGAFSRALTLWPGPLLLGAIEGLAQAERACKRTGAPDGVICRNAVLGLARRAAREAGRRS
jgi:DNA polymerase III subunit delta